MKGLVEFDKKNIENSNLPDQRKEKFEADLDNEIIQEENLREKYRKNGLFEKADPQKLLWSQDWNFDEFLFGGDIKVANDGIYLVQMNGWLKRGSSADQPDWEQEVLCFVSSGIKIRSYKAKDLLAKDEKLDVSTSGLFWNLNGGNLNNQNNTFEINKVSGQKLVFDINTGDLINGNLPSQNTNSRNIKNEPEEGSKPGKSKNFCGGTLLFTGICLTLSFIRLQNFL